MAKRPDPVDYLHSKAFEPVFLRFSAILACPRRASAAEVATPPITQGMPNSTWPATASAMQPTASAPSPT